MQIVKTDRTGRKLEQGQMIEQFGAVWLVTSVGEHCILDNDVRVELWRLAGNTDEGDQTSLFFPLNEAVTVITFTTD